MKKIKLAIVGATGLVGQTLIEVLKEEGLVADVELVLFASKKSAGKRVLICGQEYKIYELCEDALDMRLDYAIFSAGGDISKCWVKKFVSAGIVVIDNTSVFRMKKDIPLVVPEINKAKINLSHKIVANPNCSTIQLVVVLDKLRELSKIEQVVVSTYQSVSGAGRRALYDLKNSTNQVFKSGIKNNIVAQIGEVAGSGYCMEERKLMTETNKILEDSSIKVAATAVRVPIEVCHGESVYVRFENNVSLENIYKSLKCEYIQVLKKGVYYPSEIKGKNKTFVCRVRKVSKNEILFFVIADNLRRGAAYNAVEILKHLLQIRAV